MLIFIVSASATHLASNSPPPTNLNLAKAEPDAMPMTCQVVVVSDPAALAKLPRQLTRAGRIESSLEKNKIKSRAHHWSAL